MLIPTVLASWGCWWFIVMCLKAESSIHWLFLLIRQNCLKGLKKCSGDSGGCSDVFPYLNLAQWLFPTCLWAGVSAADGAFQGPSGRNVQTPAVWLSGAFRCLRMFVLSRFLSACRNCNLKSLIAGTFSWWTLQWDSPEICVPEATALCGVILWEGTGWCLGHCSLGRDRSRSVRDAAAALQPRFCWRRQAQHSLALLGLPELRLTCATLFSNHSASAGFTSGISAHLLSTVVVGISRRDFSNPRISNWIAYGNVCMPVKMFSFTITRGCRGSSSVHTWLFACSSLDSTTSVRLMTWFHRIFSSKLPLLIALGSS